MLLPQSEGVSPTTCFVLSVGKRWPMQHVADSFAGTYLAHAIHGTAHFHDIRSLSLSESSISRLPINLISNLSHVLFQYSQLPAAYRGPLAKPTCKPTVHETMANFP